MILPKWLFRFSSLFSYLFFYKQLSAYMDGCAVIRLKLELVTYSVFYLKKNHNIHSSISDRNGLRVKMCSDWKRWMWWAPQDYIQSQCKDTIRGDVTSSDANLIINAMRITRCGIHRLHHLMAWSWKYWTFPATSCEAVLWQPVLRFSRRQVTFPTARTLPESADRTLNQTSQLKLLLCVNIMELRKHDFIHHGIIIWTWRHEVYQHFWDFHNWYCAERMIKSAVVHVSKWQALLPPDDTS